MSTATITRSSSTITASMPLRIESLNFLHGMHWAKRASLTKMHRTYAWAAMREADTAPRLMGPVVSRHPDKAAFERKYGHELDLLELTQRLVRSA